MVNVVPRKVPRPKKTLRACGPSGFGLGISLGSTFTMVRSTVRLRFIKSISGHHFQTIGKLASNDFNYHTGC